MGIDLDLDKRCLEAVREEYLDQLGHMQTALVRSINALMALQLQAEEFDMDTWLAGESLPSYDRVLDDLFRRLNELRGL